MPHFMLKEIVEQEKVLSQEIDRGKVIFEEIGERLLASKRIKIIACGTSYHSGLIGKYLLEDLASFSADVEIASEFQHRNPLIDDREAYLFISQSGETSDILRALDLVKKSQALTIGLTNSEGSTLSKIVDHTVYNQAGTEVSIASTKVFTSQIIILLFLALFLKEKKGETLSNEFINDISKIPAAVREVLDDSSGIKELAERYKDSSSIIFIGQRYAYPIAMEAALKVKETSYIHAEAVSTGELRHGPIAMIDSNFPVFFLGNPTNKIIEEVKKRGADLNIIEVASLRKEISPILLSIPIQLFAYYLSIAKGLNPDKPRSLSKAVI